MNNDCEAIVVNLVESGAISTAQTIMNQIQAAGIPTVWFNRPVSTNNEEAANLFLNNPASAFVGTNFEDAGVMQGELIGQYLVEHYNDIDLNGDGKISYIMFKGDEANQEAIARTALAVEYANKALVAAGKPEIEFYDASNANKYLVDPNGSWSNVFSSEQMQTVLSMYNEGNGNMVELVMCNNDDMACDGSAERWLQPRRRHHRDPRVRRGRDRRCEGSDQQRLHGRHHQAGQRWYGGRCCDHHREPDCRQGKQVRGSERELRYR